jgi:hypothetical protein
MAASCGEWNKVEGATLPAAPRRVNRPEPAISGTEGGLVAIWGRISRHFPI